MTGEQKMANKRIYYAIQQVRLGDNTDIAEVHGLQTIGMTTNFNLEQVFEIGQLEIYQNVEEVPEIEVTLNKVLDGYPLVYIMATENGAQNISSSKATSPELTGRQNARCDMELSIYPDSQNSADGDSLNSPYSVVVCSGMYVSSISYTFPVDGNFTEDVTLVGNDKIWSSKKSSIGQFDNSDSPAATTKVNRRQHLDIPSCFFPSEIPGVESGKLVDNSSSGEGFSTHFQNITVSCDLGRETINELGRFAPYHRYVTFPVEVTSEFEVLAVQGDGIQATESGFYKEENGQTVEATPADTGCVYRFNLRDQKIYLQTCEGTKIYLGDKNKLSSVNYTGGDTGGGNVTVSYSYTTYNDFAVAHSGGALSKDTDVGGSGWYDALTDAGYNPA
jgi:hypothetical protein